MSDKRTWYDPRAVDKKYREQHTSGVKGLEQGKTATQPTREGFPESWSSDIATAFIFDTPSERLVHKEITTPLAQLAEKHGVEVWLAGRDFPLHASLLNAAVPTEPHDRLSIINALNAHKTSEEAIAEVREVKSVSFDSFMLTPGGIIMAARNIHHRVVSFRNRMTGVMRTLKLEVRSMDNILHVTLARYKRLPEGGGSASKISKFIRDFHWNFRVRILSRGRYTLQVSHVHVGDGIMGMERTSLTIPSV